MKKFVTMILAALMCLSVFSFVGCGDLVSGYGGVQWNEDKGEMYEDSKEGKTAIKINYATGYQDEWIKQIARSFLLDAGYGDDYYFVLKADSEITTSMSSKLESGVNLSDIYMPLASNWQSYVAQGLLEPLDDLYQTTIPGEDITVADKITGTWKTYGLATRNSEDNYYVFPWNENIGGIIYNKTMFDRYNWQVPETVNELDALCKKIIADTNGRVAPFVYPGTIGGYWDFVGTNWWLQYSGLDKLNEFMRFESAEVYNPNVATSPGYGKRRMLETFEELIVENKLTYTLEGSASKDHLRAQISFGAGEAAMIPNGNWLERESGDVIEDEIRMMAVPAVDDALTDDDGNVIKYNYCGQPDFICIPAEAKQKEIAKTFLAYMCTDEMLVLYTNLTGAPRPFAYDTDKCEVTEFGKSCLQIWKESTTWFEASTSPRWTANKVKKYQTTPPFTTLLNDSTISALGWCRNEYDAVKRDWATLI